MADSSLVTYEDYSPHFGYPQGSHGRSSGVGCICVHHMADNLSVETCGRVFHNCETSANYGISSDGKVGQYVREADAPWAAGNKACNNFAIHIEVANDGGASTNWHVSETAIQKCIALITDICIRKGWKQFRYSGDDQNGELIAHKWYASTACPGPYLYSQFPRIAAAVQKNLDEHYNPKAKELYRVRKSWADSKTQAGAYKSLDNAKKKADEKAKEGYKVFDWNGNVVYTPAVEEAKAEEKVEPKSEEKAEAKTEPESEPVAKRKQKSILARLFKKYGKGGSK